MRALSPLTEPCEQQDFLRESDMAQCRRTFFPISRRQMMNFTGVIIQARGESDLSYRSINHSECLYKAACPPHLQNFFSTCFSSSESHKLDHLVVTFSHSPYHNHNHKNLDRQNSTFSQQTKIYYHGLNLERRLARQTPEGKLSVYLRVRWRGPPRQDLVRAHDVDSLAVNANPPK